MTLPGADELFFRPTAAPPTTGPTPPPADSGTAGPEQPKRGRAAGARRRIAPQPSGRQRHDEKITVYVSAAELLALEQTRLALRAEHGLTADRGRIVREAVAVLLADFEEHGENSMLVQRLSEN
ncbi:hypothetical protein NI17_003480 [Thermobifida halotolerans]|uniref:Uncharacterized protein n=1 Tax=Thermobifida halotolerans TaxID=483545 RepID=A0A399G478_9ACTN|nr:hypothetical protein NI17_003480 [Thermobifida halotolerans]